MRRESNVRDRMSRIRNDQLSLQIRRRGKDIRDDRVLLQEFEDRL
jgi:hypothetical protein